MNTQPSIEKVNALDGRIFATLSEVERAVLCFYLSRQRKFGVDITLIN